MPEFSQPPPPAPAQPHIEGMAALKTLDDLNAELSMLSDYKPDDRAVLLFIQRGGRGSEGELLLIEKRGGLAGGRLMGPEENWKRARALFRRPSANVRKKSALPLTTLNCGAASIFPLPMATKFMRKYSGPTVFQGSPWKPTRQNPFGVRQTQSRMKRCGVMTGSGCPTQSWGIIFPATFSLMATASSTARFSSPQMPGLSARDRVLFQITGYNKEII